MTALALQHTTNFFKVIVYPFNALSDAIDKHRKINATFKELNKLTDRELHDIGIGRSQIMGIAYEVAYGDKDA
jgi:uncharacterized protein YjiS (DUF1127 family)